MKITSPAGQLAHGPHNPFGGAAAAQPPLWWVDGITYTDDPALIAWFERKPGYVVETGAPTQAHLDAVARMEADSRHHGHRPSVARQDAAEPGPERNYAPYNPA